MIQGSGVEATISWMIFILMCAVIAVKYPGLYFLYYVLYMFFPIYPCSKMMKEKSHW